MNEITQMLLNKITALAIAYQQPLIILENPKHTAATQLKDGSDLGVPRLVATIGNAATKFDGYCISDLTEVYASLRSQLENEETSEDTVENAKSTQ